MKSIYQLIPDIYSYLGEENGITDLLASNMGADISSALQRSLGKAERRGLRLSGLGPKCPRQLWYEYHYPEFAEPLPPYARIKYTYGHIIEHMIIGLAKACGHTVEGEQDELIVDGIAGHRDCVIDGCVVDVKSAASRSFLKFREGTIKEDDPFGYLDQIDGYVLGSIDDPLVLTKDRGFLLAVDKQLGHLALYEHRLRHEHIRERIRTYKEIVGRSTAPSCECRTVPDGKSGNEKLDVKGSYNSHKFNCRPGIRTFLYSDGPRYLTKVVREPRDVVEVDRYGTLVRRYQHNFGSGDHQMCEVPREGNNGEAEGFQTSFN